MGSKSQRARGSRVSEGSTPGRGWGVILVQVSLGARKISSSQIPSGFENLCDTAAGGERTWVCLMPLFTFKVCPARIEFAKLSFPVKLSLIQNTAIT